MRGDVRGACPGLAAVLGGGPGSSEVDPLVAIAANTALHLHDYWRYDSIMSADHLCESP